MIIILADEHHFLRNDESINRNHREVENDYRRAAPESDKPTAGNIPRPYHLVEHMPQSFSLLLSRSIPTITLTVPAYGIQLCPN